MATQTSLFPFIGKLGNLIGYCRNGKYFLRSMPSTVRQTTATRRASRRFGAASTKAALIRSAIIPELDIPFDSTLINRLNKLLINGGNRTAAITGFRFNQQTGADRFFSVAPRIPRMSDEHTLHIPTQTLCAIKDITSLEITVIATRIDFVRHKVISTDLHMITLDIREDFAGADIHIDAPGSGTLVLTMQIKGMHNHFSSTNRKYYAADIIAVIPPQPPRVPYKPTPITAATIHVPQQTIFHLSHSAAITSVIKRE